MPYGWKRMQNQLNKIIQHLTLNKFENIICILDIFLVLYSSQHGSKISTYSSYHSFIQTLYYLLY